MLRKLFLSLLAACLALIPFAASAQCASGYALVTASDIGGNNPLATGTLTVTAVNAQLNPFNFSVMGGGVWLMQPQKRKIVAGALTGTPLCLPRTDQSSQIVGYHFVGQDTSPTGGNARVLDANNVAITSSTFSLDTYTFPQVASWTLSLPQIWQGTYSASSTYGAGAVVTENGNTYISLIGANKGNDPAATPSDWQALSSAGTFTGGNIANATAVQSSLIWSSAKRQDGVDLNTLKNCGYYDGTALLNAPAALGSNFAEIQNVCSADETQSYLWQFVYDMTGAAGNAWWYRYEIAGVWSAWVTMGTGGSFNGGTVGNATYGPLFGIGSSSSPSTVLANDTNGIGYLSFNGIYGAGYAGISGSLSGSVLTINAPNNGFIAFAKHGTPFPDGCARFGISPGTGEIGSLSIPCALYGGAYASGTTYPAGAIITYLGSAYLSLVSSNTANTPSSSPSDWQPLSAPATSSSLGTVELASGQTSTTLAKVATTNNAQDLANFAITVAPQNRLAGSITAAAAPDNLTGDRFVVDFRSNGSATPLSDEFDSVGGGTPTLANGIASGTFYAARNFPAGAYTSWTIQCDAYFTTGDVVACGGVTGTPVLYGASFAGPGTFGWFDTSGTYHSLATPSTANAWYTLTTVVLNGYSSVALCPRGTDANCQTFVTQTTGAPAVSTVQAQISGTGGQLYNFRYATANLSGSSPSFPNMVAIPNADRSGNEILPINLQVPSNPSGSSVNLLVVLPPSYKPGTSVPWVMWFHGRGDHANDMFDSLGSPMSNAFLQAGYAVVGSDYSNINCWGSPNCVADIQSAVTQARMQFNLDPVPYCYAGSMGGIVMLNSIAHGAVQCRAIEAVFPVYSLTSIYQGGAGNSGFVSDIQTAYGFSGPSGYAAATSGYDPSLDAISTFVNIPTEIHCSAGDTVVPCATNGEALVNAITAAGGTASYIASSGDHGDPSNVQPAAAIDWFRKH